MRFAGLIDIARVVLASLIRLVARHVISGGSALTELANRIDPPRGAEERSR